MTGYDIKSNEKKFIHEFTKLLVPIGYKKSGKTWWKDEDDIKFLLNLQKSQWGALFYINIGLFFKSLSLSKTKIHSDYNWHFASRFETIMELSKKRFDELFSFDMPEEEIVSNVNEIFTSFELKIFPLMEKIGNYQYLKDNFIETSEFEGFIVQNIKSSDLMEYFRKK